MVSRNQPSRLNMRMTVLPSPSSDLITGTGLWEVVVFGSEHPRGSGQRFEQNRNILTRRQESQPLYPGEEMIFDVEFDFMIGQIGCDRWVLSKLSTLKVRFFQAPLSKRKVVVALQDPPQPGCVQYRTVEYVRLQRLQPPQHPTCDNLPSCCCHSFSTARHVFVPARGQASNCYATT